jgi:hypothetical protein
MKLGATKLPMQSRLHSAPCNVSSLDMLCMDILYCKVVYVI